VQLHRNIDQLTNAGANLYLIGNGAPHFIAGFRELTNYTGPIYTDPSLETFRTAQLKRGVGKTLDPRGLGKGISAFMKGHRQGRTQGDPWQQGGVLVIAPSGDVLWHHASERPGDNASAEQIVEALRGQRAAAHA
jgi:hypothetical protein